jgi:hypothetical protein
MVVEDAQTGYVGAVVRVEYGASTSMTGTAALAS